MDFKGAKPHPSCLAAIHLPHHICLEQIFHVKQGKGSRRESYKANFPVKPFRQRREEQDRSRKRAAQTLKDLLVKIAEISKEFLPVEAKILLYRVKFLQVNPQNFARSKILCAESAKSAQAINLQGCQLLFCNLFSFW